MPFEPLGNVFVITVLFLWIGGAFLPPVLTGIGCAITMRHVTWRFAILTGVLMGVVEFIAVTVVFGLAFSQRITWTEILISLGLVVVGCSVAVWLSCLLRHSSQMHRTPP